MTGDNTLFLVIASCVSSKLKNLGSEVLEDSGEVDYMRKRIRLSQSKEGMTRTRSTSTYTLGVVALFKETVNTTDWELETGLGRARLSLAITSASLATRSLSGFSYNQARLRTKKAVSTRMSEPFPD